MTQCAQLGGTTTLSPGPAVTAKQLPGSSVGELLALDRLVWVGAPGGDAYAKTPLPVSLGAPSCTFRPVAIEALGKGSGVDHPQ